MLLFLLLKLIKLSVEVDLDGVCYLELLSAHDESIDETEENNNTKNSNPTREIQSSIASDSAVKAQNWQKSEIKGPKKERKSFCETFLSEVSPQDMKIMGGLFLIVCGLCVVIYFLV